MKHRRAVIAATVGVAVLTGTGVAGATGAISNAIPDSNGVLHACYPTNGTLKPMYLIDKGAGTSCPPGYSALDFNQRGPQGPQGARGPQGAQGPAGAAHAYAAASSQSQVFDLSADLPTVLGAVNVPAGSYVVDAKVAVYNEDHDNRYLSCELFDDSGVIDNSDAILGAFNGDSYGPADTLTLPLLGTRQISTPGQISIACASDNAVALHVRIVATQVGGIN